MLCGGLRGRVLRGEDYAEGSVADKAPKTSSFLPKRLAGTQGPEREDEARAQNYGSDDRCEQHCLCARAALCFVRSGPSAACCCAFVGGTRPDLIPCVLVHIIAGSANKSIIYALVVSPSLQ